MFVIYVVTIDNNKYSVFSHLDVVLQFDQINYLVNNHDLIPHQCLRYIRVSFDGFLMKQFH